MAYIVATTEPAAKDAETFDPYEILDLPMSATEAEIKVQYRKYTLKFHPDKVRDAVNMTADEIQKRFVDITKAYKTLTDAEIRENYLKYGHPDGPQQTSHGVALPKFLVDGKGSPFFVAMYALFFGVVLPYFVGKWWGAIQKYTKAGIHTETAGMFFETLVKDQPLFVTEKKILELLSNAEEYKILLPSSTEEEILELLEYHLARKEHENEDRKLTVVSRAPIILDGFLDIATAFKYYPLCQRIIEVRRAIIQAVPIENNFLSAELLQLPGATAPDVYKSTIQSLSDLAKVKDDAEAAKHIGAKTPEIGHLAVEAAQNIPKLHILDAYFKTPGEDIVPPKSPAIVIIKYALTFGDLKLPKLSREEMSEVETLKLIKDPLLNSNKGPKIPSTIAPYFPGTLHPSWSLFLLGGGQNLVEGPIELSRGKFTTQQDVDKYLEYQKTKTASSTEDSDESASDPEFIKVNTVKIKLSAATPDAVGKFAFVVSFLSKDYFGLDLSERIEVEIKNPPQELVDETVYDIPEPEEDSIAGAMSQLKGNAPKTDKVKSDDDSDLEEEEEDLSDIDTDTDAEFSSDDDDDSKKNK